jgi:5-amino-6-(5-phosphoribosylamino)uracil reductase
MRVFSNNAMSLDGKLATRRQDHVALGSEEDRRWMGVLRAGADAVLVGGATFRTWDLPCVEPLGRGPHTAEAPIVNAVLTRSGAGPRDSRFFRERRTRPLVLGGPDADLQGFPDNVIVRRCAVPSTVGWALDVLEHDFGCRSLLVEGGGDLLFQLLAIGRLDELFVTLCPCVVGGGQATTLVDGEGFLAGHLRELRLLEHRRLADEIFLHYAVRT